MTTPLAQARGPAVGGSMLVHEAGPARRGTREEGVYGHAALRVATSPICAVGCETVRLDCCAPACVQLIS